MAMTMSPQQTQRMQGQITQLVLAQVREQMEQQAEAQTTANNARFNLIDAAIDYIKFQVETQIELGRQQTGAVLDANIKHAERAATVLGEHMQKAEAEIGDQKNRRQSWPASSKNGRQSLQV